MVVDWREQPGARWRLGAEQPQQANDLLSLYERDLGLPPELAAALEPIA